MTSFSSHEILLSFTKNMVASDHENILEVEHNKKL